MGACRHSPWGPKMIEVIDLLQDCVDALAEIEAR
jgi:hypothetical protein